MKNIIVFGHKQHGKDTACEFIRDELGLDFNTSSEFACKKFLFAQMKDQHGYASMRECFEDRDSHRQYWFEAIRDYNRPDGTRLGREMFGDAPVYCGIRNDEEFFALKEAGLIDLAIWIDASKRKPLESNASMKLTEEDADIVISNNGTKEQLFERLRRLFLMFSQSAVAKKDTHVTEPERENRLMVNFLLTDESGNPASRKDFPYFQDGSK